jgi:hypothetical protein
MVQVNSQGKDKNKQSGVSSLPQTGITVAEESKESPKFLLEYTRSLLKQPRPHSAAASVRASSNNKQQQQAVVIQRPHLGNKPFGTDIADEDKEMSKFRKLKGMPSNASDKPEPHYSERRRRRDTRGLVNTAAFLQHSRTLAELVVKVPETRSERALNAGGLPLSAANAQTRPAGKLAVPSAKRSNRVED